MFGIDDMIGGAVGAIGNVLSGQSNAKQAREMYQHRYQWEVKDLKKAGLNPALAYGHNAPIPQTQGLEPLGDSITKGMQASAQRGQANAAKALTEAQTRLLNAQSADLVEGAKLKNQLTRSQIGATSASAAYTGAQTANARAQLDVIRQTWLQMLQDYQWKSATWDKRMTELDRRLELQGLSIDRAKLDNEIRTLEKQIKGYQVPMAKAEADFWTQTGSASQVLRMLAALRGIIL